MKTVASIFTRTATVELDKVSLYIASSDTFVPADVLAKTNVTDEIYLACPTNTYQLKLDINAFRNTKAVTTSVTIENCNLGRTNALSFLTGFNALRDFKIFFSTNINVSRELP